jgi:hypothetical protein
MLAWTRASRGGDVGAAELDGDRGSGGEDLARLVDLHEELRRAARRDALGEAGLVDLDGLIALSGNIVYKGQRVTARRVFTSSVRPCPGARTVSTSVADRLCGGAPARVALVHESERTSTEVLRVHPE